MQYKEEGHKTYNIRLYRGIQYLLKFEFLMRFNNKFKQKMSLKN